MDAKTFKQLQDSVKANKKAVAQLDSQIANLDAVMSGTIDGLKGDEKQKVKTLQGMVNRAINKAKTGGNYNEVIDQIKATFKNDLNNGRNSNK